MRYLMLPALLAALLVGALDWESGPVQAVAVIDEGGYYNVLAYGQWVFEHDVHGSHHCCAATLTDTTVLSEDVAQEWTQGPYIVQFVFVDGVRWEQWYDPYTGAGWWEAYPGPGIDPYCFGCG